MHFFDIRVIIKKVRVSQKHVFYRKAGSVIDERIKEAYPNESEESKEREEHNISRPWGDSEHDPKLHSRLKPKATPNRSYDPEHKHYREPPG